MIYSNVYPRAINKVLKLFQDRASFRILNTRSSRKAVKAVKS